ncbi:AAA family ATPase [Massilia sp. NP310]|uniref:AAA family ATPase n=1 Tax=Massilia sp. NP310 TaxID=2861282 RepID=UPI001C625FC2|nr:AAA family ATPase [Massilia sp. NP310]QYG03946.1 AAA family ATPase [Massilia sp. NP310]
MPSLQRLKINGLYGERDIDIPFLDNIKIIVAENGYGKTTVLNALYALASGNITRLRKLPFETIEVNFDDGSKYLVDKKALTFTGKMIEKNPFFEHIKRILGEDEAVLLAESFLQKSPGEFRSSPQFQAARRKIDIPASAFYEYLGEIRKSVNNGTVISKARDTLKSIRQKLGFNVLYLPTYRRVEQDFRDRRSSSENNENSDNPYDDTINFGMADVDSRIKELTSEILSSSVEWFSKVNGEMLGQLVEGFKVDENLKKSIQDPDAIKIVLDRIGANVKIEQKKQILKLIETGDIFHGHDPLIYFISNLVKVYEQQRENDRSIQAFTEVCNRYLGDKKLEYNESLVSVRIVRRKNNREVDIETLSSGEKQIISLFCSLYLKRETNVAIFFDEPELSLSLEWQKTLLPDVMNSGRCGFLFATTHSPFIFENDLSRYAVDLGHYIKER